MDPRTDTQVAFEARMRRMERSARLFWLSGALMMGTAIFLAAARPGESQDDRTAVRGTKFKAPFSILDKRGRVIFQVTQDSDGGGDVHVFDQGKKIIDIGHDNGIRGVMVLDLNGKPVAHMGTGEEHNQRGIDVHDANGTEMVEIGSGENTNRGIHILDDQGKPIIDMGIGDEGRGLDVHNTAGNPIAQLHADTNGGELHLFDNNGGQTGHLP